VAVCQKFYRGRSSWEANGMFRSYGTVKPMERGVAVLGSKEWYSVSPANTTLSSLRGELQVKLILGCQLSIMRRRRLGMPPQSFMKDDE
jgi:hypothetical protein